MNIDPLAEKCVGTVRTIMPLTILFYFMDHDGIEATASSGGESLDSGDFDVNVDEKYGRMMKKEDPFV